MATLKVKHWHPQKQGFDLIAAMGGTPLRQLRLHGVLSVFVAIGLWADDDGMAIRTLTQLAKDSGYSISIVSNAIDELEEMDLIVVLDREPMRGDMPDKQRWGVFKRDNYTCQYCGTTDGPFVIDHIIPVSKGGRGQPENLITSCPRCNRHKSNRIVG